MASDDKKFTSAEQIREMQRRFEDVADWLGQVRKMLGEEPSLEVKLVIDKANFYLDYIHPWAEALVPKCRGKLDTAKKKQAKQQMATARIDKITKGKSKAK